MVDWFKPGFKAGGPIQSAFNFAYAFKDDFEILVLTTDTDHGETSAYEGIVSNTWLHNLWPGISVYYANKTSLNVKQLQREIIAANADYVYLNHLFSPYFVLYPLWLKLKGQLKSKIVLCPRGALYESALSVKWYKKRPVIALLKLLKANRKLVFHATNEREYNAIQHFFPGSKISIADNLPQTNQPANVQIKKERGSVKCIFISRIVPIKNLLLFLEVLKKITVNVTFTIVGPIEDDEYWAECREAINKLDQNIQVKYEGAKNNQELPALLAQHHLFVLPTAGENFGHSIFEALLNGRPVLISDQTPWQNLASVNAGWDIPLQNIDEFRNIIDMVGNWTQEEFNKWSNGAWEFARRFIQNPTLKEGYFQLFA